MSAPASDADANKNNTNPSSTGGAPESPTTVKPFEMDDDDVQDTPPLDSTTNTSTTTPAVDPKSTAAASAPASTDASAPSAAAAATASTTSAPAPASDAQVPAKPPRPATEQQKKETILKEAFPSIDINVIKAILAASGGRIDPAFNALLGMSDPDAVQNEPEAEAAPPPQPPRPSGRPQMSQMEADELYARQLAQHYDSVGAYEARTSSRGGRQPRREGLRPSEEYDREHNFIDDELPVIKENLRQGFLDTQKSVNSWFTNLKKKIDDAYNEDEDESQPSRHRPGRRSGEGSSRRSADYDRYDADPQVLGDDFSTMRLNSDGSQTQGVSGGYRPPQSKSPRPEGRKVAFKEGHEEMDAYGASPRVPPKDGAPTPPPATKQSKWQPLSSVEPNPIAENDPFSLGDSEDEREAKSGIKMEDSERLKQATADAMSESLVDKKGEASKTDASGKKE